MERKIAFRRQEFLVVPDISRHYSRRELFNNFFETHDEAWFYLRPSNSGGRFNGLFASLDEVADSEDLTPSTNVYHVIKRCGFYVSDDVVIAGDCRKLPCDAEREHRNPEYWGVRDEEVDCLTEGHIRSWEEGYVPPPEEMLKIVREELAGK